MTNTQRHLMLHPSDPLSRHSRLPGPLYHMVPHVSARVDSKATTVLWCLLGRDSPDTMIRAAMIRAAMREQAL
ncbi:hypothetical protein LCGC14_0909320 [marine sediment metagenome]|uniref:Uncharacterized protein n=1 Tax=marine sediment metagenome TaxID=412755 RepID=A0A0F9NU51_9ZZZZ